LENKAVERLMGANDTPRSSRQSSRQSSVAGSVQSTDSTTPSLNNAFTRMMGKKTNGLRKNETQNGTKNGTTTPKKVLGKRKFSSNSEPPAPKSDKSSRHESPSTRQVARTRTRTRTRRQTYKIDDDDEDDNLDDEQFETKLAEELAANQNQFPDEEIRDADELERVRTLELASKSSLITGKHTGLKSVRKTNRRKETWQPHGAVAARVQ
jgi:ATP-dependent DNA helicase